MDVGITGGLVHFLRPWWFVGFLPLGFMIFFLIRQRVGSQGWEAVCDAHLLPHLLVGSHRAHSSGPYLLLAMVWSLTLLALAGPVWSKLPQPVFRAQSALVLVLDLSRSMDAQDIQPSRLTRAKHKLLDILKGRQEGQTALIVYSGEPYVVSPLTDDAKTISAMVSSLDTNLMPAQGSRPDMALSKAHELLEQSHISRGDILLITDGIEEEHMQSVAKKLSTPHRVSVLGVGTIDGAPIPQKGGFVKDQDGAIVIPKLNPKLLSQLAKTGEGSYATISIDDQDLEILLPAHSSMMDQKQQETTQRTTVLWREEGPWLLFGIVALALPAFRQGWLGVLVVMLLFTPSRGDAFFDEAWWSRPDQQGSQALEQDDPQKAAALFENSSWKGVANYRAGNFQEAVENFSQDDTADGHFNRGNALARAGQFQEALQAYQTALKHAPTHEDAQHNHQLIEKLLKPQEQQRSDSGETSSQDEQSPDSKQSSGTSSQMSKDQQHDEHDQQTGDQANAESAQMKNDSPQETERPSSQPSSESSEEPANSVHAQQEDTKSDGGEERHEGQGGGERSDVTQEQETGDDDPSLRTAAGLSKQEKTELESQQSMEQWLRRIPDDPGGLLRRKFLLEHRRRQEAGQLYNSGKTTW